jgi:NADPH-dependent curcumin reductase
MEGEVVAEVLQSRHPSYCRGDMVQSRIGWRTHAVVARKEVRKVRTAGNPATTALGVLGMPGFTAYSGMKVIGQPKPGETVVVGAASGPVGSLVGQLAQLAGARAVGVTGGAAKCAYVRDQLRFDAVVDHRAKGLPGALATACPDGIDVYFESVGGPTWDAVLPLLNGYARIPICGLFAYYNGEGPEGRTSLAQTMLTVLRRSLLMRGFINTEFVRRLLREFSEGTEPLGRCRANPLPRRYCRRAGGGCWSGGAARSRPSWRTASPSHPADTMLAELAGMAGLRWTIETLL